MVNAVHNETPECLLKFSKVLAAASDVLEVKDDDPAKFLENVVSASLPFGWRQHRLNRVGCEGLYFAKMLTGCWVLLCAERVAPRICGSG